MKFGVNFKEGEFGIPVSKLEKELPSYNNFPLSLINYMSCSNWVGDNGTEFTIEYLKPIKSVIREVIVNGKRTLKYDNSKKLTLSENGIRIHSDMLSFFEKTSRSLSEVY